MGVGNGLSTPVGSNWLHVIAITLNTKQQQQQQQQQKQQKQNKKTVRLWKSWGGNDATVCT